MMGLFNLALLMNKNVDFGENCVYWIIFLFPWWIKENYTFTVGYHELSGSKVPLKKPFLVMKKIKHSVAGKSDDDTGLSSKVELEVIGIVRHRILFKNRPKALISSKMLVWFGCNCCVCLLLCVTIIYMLILKVLPVYSFDVSSDMTF